MQTMINLENDYFEEDEIIGKLCNEDGTEYEPPKPKTKTNPVVATETKVVPPKTAPKPQISMFDLISSENKEIEEKTDSNEDTTEVIPENS